MRASSFSIGATNIVFSRAQLLELLNMNCFSLDPKGMRRGRS